MTMFLNIALGLTALTLVQAAGYFFKLNQNLVKGACTLIIMAGIWFGIQTSREEALKERSAIQSSKSLQSPRS
jgi:hypothetical protein